MAFKRVIIWRVGPLSWLLGTMARNFNQFDVVQVIAIRADRFAHSQVFYQRSPAIGDTGTILESYTDPECAYEVECSEPSTGETVWLNAMYPEELQLTKVTAQPTKLIAPLLLRVISVLILGFGSFFSWFFKDGLGPNSIESVGYISFTRFLAGFWPFGIVAIVLVLSSCLIPSSRKNGR